uniref:Uncharacterized protein n=1 Tax=Eutreptiella gymnastica TaxID=73025 RepID=A0A7S4CWE0_9EUGL
MLRTPSVIHCTWPAFFCSIPTQWRITTSIGHKRNYMRTLIRNSPSIALRSAPPNTSDASYSETLHQALNKRHAHLRTALKDVTQWLHDHPIPNVDFLRPLSTCNPWNIPPSEYSTPAHQLTKLSFPKDPPKTNSRPRTAHNTCEAPSILHPYDPSSHTVPNTISAVPKLLSQTVAQNPVSKFV